MRQRSSKGTQVRKNRACSMTFYVIMLSVCCVVLDVALAALTTVPVALIAERFIAMGGDDSDE